MKQSEIEKDLDKITLNMLFDYHPPVEGTDRKEKHEKINQASKDFAEVIFEVIENPEHRRDIIQAIQVARMKANQFVTYEDLGFDLYSL